MMDCQTRISIVQVERGQTSTDIVLANAKLLNVLTREIYLSDIVIKGGRIAAVTPVGAHSWDASVRRDLAGRYVTPGFMDPHVHIEGSLVTATQFSKAVVPRGVT